jgi:hypothetical protein
MAGKQVAVGKSVASVRPAAKVVSRVTAARPEPVDPRPMFEEATLRSDAASLCLLINRRARTMRVVDFRAGASPQKRRAVEDAARRQGAEKVVVLVEREESLTWGRMGFVREGNIPGFYKRSDAYVMGLLVPPGASPSSAPPRAASSGVFSIAQRSLYSRPPQAEVVASDDDAEDETSPDTAAASARAEKTVVHARKLAKTLSGAARPATKVATIRAEEVGKRLQVATRAGRLLTGFERFGRDATRDDVIVSVKGLGDLVVGIELQACYRNAFLETFTTPRDDRERDLYIAALQAVCERLESAGTVCAFAITPADDVRAAAVYVTNGFRRTGVLREHLRVDGRRVDALLWSAKLAAADAES